MRQLQQANVSCDSPFSGGGVCSDYSNDCAAPGGPKIFQPRRVRRIFQVGRVQPNPTQPSLETLWASPGASPETRWTHAAPAYPPLVTPSSATCASALPAALVPERAHSPYVEAARCAGRRSHNDAGVVRNGRPVLPRVSGRRKIARSRWTLGLTDEQPGYLAASSHPVPWLSMVNAQGWLLVSLPSCTLLSTGRPVYARTGPVRIMPWHVQGRKWLYQSSFSLWLLT